MSTVSEPKWATEAPFLFLRAAAVAVRLHNGQERKWTIEPYINHPVRVANDAMSAARGIEPGMRTDILTAAAILHDTLEDCYEPALTVKSRADMLRVELRDQAPLDTVEDRDIDRAVDVVAELTNLYTPEHYPKLRRAGRKAAEFERLATSSREAVLIKLVDRRDNLDEINRAIAADKIHPRKDKEFVNLYCEESYDLAIRLRNTWDGVFQSLASSVIQSARDIPWSDV